MATTDDVLAFAELSPDIFRDFRVQSAAEDCILVSLALAHLRGRPAPAYPQKDATRGRATRRGRHHSPGPVRVARARFR